MSARTNPASRRLLGASGAIGLAAGTALAVASVIGSPTADAASIELKYTCIATAFGTDIPQGEWSAAVTVGLPATVNVGEQIPGPDVTAVVTTSDASGDTMRNLNVKSVDGTSDATYTLTSATETQNQVAKLAIPNTKVPPKGGLVTTASGKGQDATAPKTPGDVKVDIGDFTGTLNAHTSEDPAAPALGLGLKCTLNPNQNTQIGVIKVVDPNAPSPSDSSSTSSSPSGSTTGSPSDPGTGPGETTGPPIITDGGTGGDGANLSLIAGAGIAATGLGVLGFGATRRMRSNR